MILPTSGEKVGQRKAPPTTPLAIYINPRGAFPFAPQNTSRFPPALLPMPQARHSPSQIPNPGHHLSPARPPATPAHPLTSYTRHPPFPRWAGECAPAIARSDRESLVVPPPRNSVALGERSQPESNLALLHLRTDFYTDSEFGPGSVLLSIKVVDRCSRTRSWTSTE
jgi:hypothetical protein